MKVIIDRFEEDFAVIEDNGVIINVPRSELPENATEGSVLIKNADGRYEFDISSGEKRKIDIKNRFDALRKKK